MSVSSPKVSVLMSVYNGLPYLQEAIESVLNQTLKDFEFLIIDDASTDKSVACIESYKDPCIKFIHNEQNIGQVRSLNKGLAIARGEYIARLDQDDVCLPTRLEEQVRFLDRRSDIAVVCSWEHTIDPRGRKIRSWSREIKNYGEFLGTLLLGKCPVWHPSSMFRREVVASLGDYDPSYAPAEDFDLWSRIAMARHGGAIVPQFLLLQRRHKKQQTAGNFRPFLENTRRSHEKMVYKYCDDTNVLSVASLLRMDDTFWDYCISKKDLKTTLQTLENVFSRIDAIHGLTNEESSSLKRVVYRRLGFGVRMGGTMSRLPAPLFCLLFFCGSPLLIPIVRRAAMYGYARLCEIRYLKTFIQLRLGK